MTREEVFQALMQGKKIHWSNEGYRVLTQRTATMDDMIVVFTANQYTTPLTDACLQHCFVMEA